jgi:branched-chain amino acid transport system substrate-binding protein
MKRKLIGLVLLFALLLEMSGCDRGSKNEKASDEANVIRIGEISPQTGTDAPAGTSVRRGVELYVDQVNQKGGVRGKKIELISLDDQGKPEQAAVAITQLITQKKVKAVIGTLSSSGTIAMGPIAQNYQIPLITPTGTHPKVTEMGSSIFRVCFTEPFQGEVLASFSYDKLKARKVAILYDIKSEYSTGLTNLYSSTFIKRGGEIVSSQSYASGDIDFKSQLTLIRTKKPDAIFLPNFFTDVGLIARQVRELGMDIPLIGGDAWDSPKLVEVGGKAMENGYFSNHYAEDQNSPQVQEFIVQYKKKYGVVPDGPAALSYDAAAVLVNAIEKALGKAQNDSQEISPSAIRENISSTRNFSGVTGVISFDANRNPIKSSVILKVEQGRFRYQTTIHPTQLIQQ